MRSRLIAATLGGGLSLILASTALAMDCTNASRSSPYAGAQVVVDAQTGEILWMTPGLLHRVQQGLIDPATGAGFHGIVAFDLDGDGVADVSTWMGVGPDGDEIPINAQLNGPACRGLTSIGVFLTQCQGR
jgi:hypothetical protein